MHSIYSRYRMFRAGIGFVMLWSITLPLHSWGLDASQPIPMERREIVSLADAAVRALQKHLDLTLSLNGQYNRTVNPLNRPIFGGTGGALNQITLFDQRTHAVTVDANTNLIAGGTIDVNYSPQRNSINQSVAEGFLFNPAWTGGLAFMITQPLLRNAGVAINKTFISIAQNNAVVEQHMFRGRVMTVIALVEHTYWELVFGNENLKMAQAALKAAEEPLATNRAKAQGHELRAIVDYNKSLSNLARQKATMLDRYQIEVS